MGGEEVMEVAKEAVGVAREATVTGTEMVMEMATATATAMATGMAMEMEMAMDATIMDSSSLRKKRQLRSPMAYPRLTMALLYLT